MQDQPNIENEDVQFNKNDQLFLETLLVIIRGHTIKYSSFKKKQSIEEERRLENENENLETRINDNLLDISTLEILSEKKIRLSEIRKSKIEGV